MIKIFTLAWKNLWRYKRRSVLTGLLIVVGVVAVITFVGLSDSFKRAVVGQITDSVLSHLQVHKKGYAASIDNLPLDRMMSEKSYSRLSDTLSAMPEVKSFSPRIKFGAMLSNFVETTNVRLNGIDPGKEQATVPLLLSRVLHSSHEGILLRPGEVLLPEVVANGMKLSSGDTVVLVAHNKDGSVNGMTFKVAGIVEGLMGPGGRDGHLHIDDAASLLRMEKREISEVAVRVRDFGQLPAVATKLRRQLGLISSAEKKPSLEIHTWDQLTPFYNVVRMIDLMTVGIKGILIAVVLVSILNVMTMSVYERVREIGTLAAMGTRRGQIMALFLAEGLSLGFLSALIGTGLGVSILTILRLTGVAVAFGRSGQLFQLDPSISPVEVFSISLIVLAISTLASLHPATKAAQLKPVEALRHV